MSLKTHLLSQHLVFLLQHLHPPLQLFDLELTARVGVSAARQLALHGTLGGDGFLQRRLEREAVQKPVEAQLDGGTQGNPVVSFASAGC